MKKVAVMLVSMIFVVSSQAGAAPDGANAAVASASAPVAANISREASRPVSKGSANFFTGNVRIAMLFSANAPARATAGYVTFDPGARTAWHVHPLGQTLVVTAGEGRIQFWGCPIQEIKTGDVVAIPPGIKHWHGAAPKSAMTHMAIQESLDGKTADWLEKVSDAQYGSAGTPGAKPTASKSGSRAQQLMGDIAPKLAGLTDDVLYADVWERPGLSKRDRSLVTVSALIALSRPDQLRSHLALARANGLTQEELVEAITHMAFYSGWPSAVSAVSVAKEVFQPK